MPLRASGDVADALERALDDRTRLVVVDHIASPSALVFPVAEIVHRCRSRGIPVLVDGAHAPGHVDLDIDTIGADWYVGNGHKWLCAPKGVAFLAAAAHAHGPDIHPTTISHAFGQGLAAESARSGPGTPPPGSAFRMPSSSTFASAGGRSGSGTRSLRGRRVLRSPPPSTRNRADPRRASAPW